MTLFRSKPRAAGFLAALGLASLLAGASLRAAEDVEIWDKDAGAGNWTDTFSAGDPLDLSTSNDVSAVACAVDGKGRVYIPFIQSNGTKAHLYLARYDGASAAIWDNGASSWTTTFASGDPIDTGNAWSVLGMKAVVDGSDRVYIPFVQEDASFKTRLFLARYDGTDVKIWDTGAPGWTDTFSSGDPVDFGDSVEVPIDAAVDSAGRVYLPISSSGAYLLRYDGTGVAIWDTGAPGWTTTFASGDKLNPGHATLTDPPSVVVDGSDMAYVAIPNNDGSFNRIYLARYDGTSVKLWDNGASAWTETVSSGDPVDATSNGVSAISVGRDSAGKVYVASMGFDGTRYHAYLTRWDGTDVTVWDSGASSWTDTFSNGDPIDTGNARTVGEVALKIDGSDRVYVAFTQRNTTPLNAYLTRYDGTSMAIWDNDASGWTTTMSSGDPIDTNNGRTVDLIRAAVDGSGAFYLAFLQRNGGNDMTAYLSRYDGTDVKIWDNGASSWTDTFSNGDPIDTNSAETANGLAIAGDGAGRIYVPFYQINSGGANEVWLSRYRPAEATTYDARVSIFRQGSTTDRAVGSLIAVWNFTGLTFATDYRGKWTREAPHPGSDIARDMACSAIVKRDPTFAFAGGESNEVWRWQGTSWYRDLLPGGASTSTPLYDIDAPTSSFAVACGASSYVCRWTGATWIEERLRGAATHFNFFQVDMLTTTFGVVSGDYGFCHWTGTTWIQGRFNAGAAVGGGCTVVATDLAWAAVNETAGNRMWRWSGTSWTVATTLPGDGGLKMSCVRGERDFAVMIGYTTSAKPSIYRWTGTSWVTDMYARGLNGVKAVRTDWAWAVGDSGQIFRWTGTSWIDYGKHAPSTIFFNNVDAADTDFAVADCQPSGIRETGIWIWQGTSWFHWRTEGADYTTHMFSSGGYGNSLSTVGESLTFAAGDMRGLYKRQKRNVVADLDADGQELNGTTYRTVVQIVPRGSMWTWAGTSDTQSYFGVLDRGTGSTFEFKDNQDIGQADDGRWWVLTDASAGSGSQEDILVWVDTVGGWNGGSSTHNNNSASGVGLAEAGGVDDSPSGGDVWGESDRRISCADGGTTAWSTVAGSTGAGTGTVIRSHAMTWEFWADVDSNPSLGVQEGEELETGLRAAAGAFGTELAGLRWTCKRGRYRPRTGAWRWCRDDAAQPRTMKEPGGRIEEVAATGEKLRLRVRVDETDGGSIPLNAWTLYFSTDQTSWTQVTTTSSSWQLFDGQGTAGSTIAAPVLPGVDALGKIVEDLGTYAASEGFSDTEVDFPLKSSSAASGTTYYFEARHGGSRCLPVPGAGYPAVRTTDDATFNYLYSEAAKGPFGHPVRNLQTISGGNGEAFKVAYVTTQSGSSDKVYAVSRTNGAIARSYTASGTLDYPLIYWDSTNARYNLFFVQSGYRILALTDNGTTITANTAWSSNPKDFGGSAADPISEPIRIFDGDKQNYLFFIVTSYQNNTSTLYKVRASNGDVVTGGNYSAKAQSIGVNQGLIRVVPLYVDGTVFGYALPGSPGSHYYKIPASGGATSFSSDTSGGSFPAWYTRDTVSSGPRVLFAGGSEVFRIAASDMLGDAGWIFGLPDPVGNSIDLGSAITTGPVSPPFQIGNRVPVYVGDATQLNRLSGTDGGLDASFPYDLTGSISTGIAIQGSWLYFGTDKGYIYALSATDPTQTAGTRFRVPGDSPVVGVHVDATRSIVYFTTADGRVYQFDTR